MRSASTGRWGLLLWRVLVGAAALAAGAGAIVLTARRRQVEESPVRFEPAVIDVGQARQGETVAGRAALVNRARDKIKIGGIHTTCHCTRLSDEMLGATLAQGRRTVVPILLKTGNSDGEVSGVATVYFQAGASRYVKSASVTIRANVLPDYEIEESIIDFGIVVENRPIRRTIHVRPVGDASATVLSARTTHREFIIGEPEISEGGGITSIPVTFIPPSESIEASFSAMASLQTTSDRVPSAKVLLRARYESPVRAEPNAIVFLRTGNTEKVHRLEISSRFPSRIDELQNESPDIRVQCPSPGPARRHVIDVHLASGDGKDDLHGLIRARLKMLVEPGKEQTFEVGVPVHVLAQKEHGYVSGNVE